MKAIEIQRPGEPDVLVPCARPQPEPAAGEVLIRVTAAGVNRPDVLQRQGRYPVPPGASDLPGLEVAGTIAGGDLTGTGFRVGDRVCALANGGGYAEFCAVPSGQILPVPAGLTDVEAASLPETFFTVWSNVFDRGRLAPGETLLVQGGTSGIGVTAIQMARALGHRVLATAGSAEKVAACVRLGADVGIHYREEDFVAAVRTATGGKGVDVILDMVAGDYVPRELQCLAEDGRLVIIALLGGAQADVSLANVMMRRLTITGSTLRPRNAVFKAAIAAALKQRIWPLIEDGSIRPVIYRTFRLDAAVEAHRLMESGAHIGKIVLTVD
ncbi:MAG TPA: NAD(P)H-quinone oxidoreductase [Nevskiaceae bacterium]|nr:NAD(P)H-quinone oxidoreductase [Nevskiaceae bacterium]